MNTNIEKKRVLIDIDGVLRDFIGGLTSIYLREFPDHKVTPVTSRNLENFYPVGKEIYPFMNEQFADEILTNAPAISGSVQALHRWEHKYQIIIATDQPPQGRFATFSWLGKQRIPATEVHIVKDKSKLTGIAILDDFEENLQNFEATGRLAVCLDQPWNHHWQGPRVKTVQDFFELLTNYLENTSIDTRFFAGRD